MEGDEKVKYETIETLGVNDSVVSYHNDHKATNTKGDIIIKRDETSKIRESKPSNVPLIAQNSRKTTDMRSETMPPSDLGDAEISISALEVDVNNMSIHNEAEPQKVNRQEISNRVGQSNARSLFLVFGVVLLLIVFTIIIVSVIRK